MSGLAFEEFELLEDSKYRAYVASVDKALRNFESTSEWADLISTLGKLNKVLLSHMKYPVVPRRIIISKRLAQCLHPALPSGVHLKALEIYDIIFKCMGTNRLSQELFIYSAGLFPLFSCAAMNVRSALLMIYENHFVPLGTRLRPGLNGFLAGTLSGLEEGSDHLDRTSSLLKKVAEGVGQTEFFGCLWECILNNSNVRLPAISHITNCFNRKLCTEDQLCILGTNIDVMVCGLCQALEDSAVLVQRAALDLTLLLLPMHNTQLLRDDLTSIVTSSLIVLLRRDMSLNRRLYAWLLGSEVNLSLLSSEHPVIKKLGSGMESDSAEDKCLNGSAYFEAFSKPLLVAAFINLLKLACERSKKERPDLKPFKIIIPLLDKPEVGPLILDDIFFDLLRCFYRMRVCYEEIERSTSDKESNINEIHYKNKNTVGTRQYAQELTKNMLLVFSALTPSYPWYRLLRLLEEACEEVSKTKPVACLAQAERVTVNEVGNSTIQIGEVCQLLEYMLVILPLDTQQHLQGAQMPKVLSIVTCLFTENIEYIKANELLVGLSLCKALLEKLIPSVTQTFTEKQNEVEKSPVNSFRGYSLTGSNLTSALSELSSADASSSENGIIQIGIEAEKELSFGLPDCKETRNNCKDEPILVKEHNFDSSGEEEAIIIGVEEQAGCISMTTQNKMEFKTQTMDVSQSGLKEMQTHTSKSQNKASNGNSSDGSSSNKSRLLLKEDSFESAIDSPRALETSFLQKYIKEFEKFFLKFVETLLLDSRGGSLGQLESLLFGQVAEHFNPKQLNELMKKSLMCSSDKEYVCEVNSKSVIIPNRSFSNTEYTQLWSCIQLNSSAASHLPAFKIVCTILVELSSMPAVATFPSVVPPSASNPSLPVWLLALLSCVTASHQALPSFSHTAISTFLELVALAQSDLSSWKTYATNICEEEDQGVTTLRMLPLLTPSHTHSLIHHTYIFQFMTKELWSHLDVSKQDCHIVSSELLLQLHGLSLPTGSTLGYLPQELSVVEKEILKCLTSSNKGSDSSLLTMDVKESTNSGSENSSIIRWITLWQVSRSLSRSIVQSYPYLNRCLFLMVERLKGSSVLERSYSQNWLTESLNCGDLSRLLDPILVFLLHPHTRRVSVQHVSIEKISQDAKEFKITDSVDDCSKVESQIYAISSVGGEVMYHIGKGHSAKVKSEAQLFSSFKKQVFAFTSMSKESNKFITKQINLPNFETPATNKPISLMVNPFSQHPWIDMEDLAKMSKSEPISKNSSSSTSYASSKEEISSAWTSTDLAKCIIDEIVTKAISSHSTSAKKPLNSRRSSTSESSMGKDFVVHPLHSHMLLYMQLVDAGQCLYGLRLIKNILDSQPKLFLLSLASTSINSASVSSPLLTLLARHRRSVFGEGFDGGNIGDMIGQYRSTMYLQVVITVCLYFIRSYYPQQPHLHVRQEHLHDNRHLQVVAAEVLEALFSQLIPLMSDSPRGFSPYVKDLLNKCKVQKCVLHCLLSTAQVMRENEDAELEIRTLTQDVLEYNCSTNTASNGSPTVPHEQTYLFCLMDLTVALIKLEDVLYLNKTDPVTPRTVGDSFNSQKSFSISSLRYIVGQTIPSQPMFLWSLVIVLSQKNLRHFHSAWVTFFTSSLPHTGSALPLNTLRLMSLICVLLEELSVHYETEQLPSIAPSDYTLHLLSGLTNVVHFCLLDPSQSLVNTAPVSSSTPTDSKTVTQSPGQILYNLLHVFSPAGEILDATLDTSAVDPMTCARKTLLSHLPRLISALLNLWVSASKCSDKQAFILGNRQTVKQQIIELLSPVCHHHTSHLLAALGVVWQGISDEDSLASNLRPINSNKQRNTSESIWKCSKRQVSLVEMLAALRVLPLHTLVENVKQVFRNPPLIEGAVQKNPLEVSILQLFFLYVKQTTSPGQLSICWNPLLALVKEGILCLPPLALLVLLASLNEFVQRSPPVADKKEIKEQQDVATKLLEAVSNIAGSKLEATTWLRRNLTVKQETEGSLQENTNNGISDFSVPALSVLADLLAPMLDILYSSEEKERVIPLLMSIMANVIPYLKNHSMNNMKAFHACSQLISSLSSYHYTLKAWKKEVLELLLDNNTFKMLPKSLPHWRTLIDNLCTHDKTVFKELLSRISLSQGGSLNLFTSKEAEYETRAGLLKRLAFTIFCSETDQYLKLIPDIQERLTEVTRLGQVVPGLVAQVFLCFRVLLLRVSTRGTTSLWPIVITELVQVLLMMEQELSTDTEQFSKKHSSSHLKRLSTLDTRWVVSANNGLQAHNSPAWLSLYLAACKLLDLMIALPASHLPQFQMYRWAFVGPEPFTTAEEDSKPEKSGGSFMMKSCEFVPHIARISKLMTLKRAKMKPATLTPTLLPYSKGSILLNNIPSIDTLMDLHPFFSTLTSSSTILTGATATSSPTHKDSFPNASDGDSLKLIEEAVEKDFLEPVT